LKSWYKIYIGHDPDLIRVWNIWKVESYTNILGNRLELQHIKLVIKNLLILQVDGEVERSDRSDRSDRNDRAGLSRLSSSDRAGLTRLASSDNLRESSYDLVLGRLLDFLYVRYSELLVPAALLPEHLIIQGEIKILQG
jgi:hypothetical protein